MGDRAFGWTVEMQIRVVTSAGAGSADPSSKKAT